LIDENLLDRLSLAVAHHNARGVNPIDTVQVGDTQDFPRGSDDPDICLMLAAYAIEPWEWKDRCQFIPV